MAEADVTVNREVEIAMSEIQAAFTRYSLLVSPNPEVDGMMEMNGVMGWVIALGMIASRSLASVGDSAFGMWIRQMTEHRNLLVQKIHDESFVEDQMEKYRRAREEQRSKGVVHG